MGRFELLRLYAPFLLQGVWVTLELTSLGVLLSLALGVVGVLGRRSSFRLPYGLSTAYVEFIRGTPELLQVFLIYFGLAQYGIVLPAFVAGVLWLGIFGGAYVAEILRAGIQSIDKGQIEAAQALGLGQGSIMRKVVLPQAVALVLPPIASFGINELKASSLAYTIGVGELMSKANIAAVSSYRTMEFYLAAAAIYFAFCYPLSKLVGRLEISVAKYR
jgi:polar amino acid transport system permease protein